MQLLKFSKTIIIFIFLIIISQKFAMASDQIPAKPQDHPIALVGATVHTVTGETIENGIVLFDNGKIVDVGKNISFPPKTEIIDVKGKHIYPGLISAYTSLGLVEIDAIRATKDFSEVGLINPNVRAEVAFNPDSELIPVTRANGITVALSAPSGGLIAGTSAVMMLDGWTWEEMTLKAPVGLHIYWPRTIRPWWVRQSDEDYKKERDRQIKLIKNAFKDARAYMEAKKSESQKDIPYHNTDLRLEAMIPVLERKIPVFIHSDEIQQIESAIDWAKSEGVKIILVGGQDSWRLIDLLKINNIPVIISTIHTLPMRNWEAYDSPFMLPLKLYQSGIKFCIGDSDPGFNGNYRNLPYNAATACAYGLPKEEGLKAITIYSAEILGIENKVGSIEKGKDATLIVTTGDPLEISTNVEMEFIQGRKIALESRHTTYYKKYKEKYDRMKK
jgi:imidazolonepropionase-like amidohydrolase